MLTKRFIASIARRAATTTSHRYAVLSSVSQPSLSQTMSHQVVRFYSKPIVEEAEAKEVEQPKEEGVDQPEEVIVEAAVEDDNAVEQVEEEEAEVAAEPLPEILDEVLKKSVEFRSTPKYIDDIINNTSLADDDVELFIRDEVEEYASHLLNIRPPVFDHHLGTMALKFKVVQATEQKYNMRFPAKVLQNIYRVRDVVNYVVYEILTARAQQKQTTVEKVPSNVSSFLEHTRRREFLTRKNVVGAISKRKRRDHTSHSFFKSDFEMSENDMRVMELNSRQKADKEIFEKRFIRRKPHRFWKDGVYLGRKSASPATVNAFLKKDYVKKDEF